MTEVFAWPEGSMWLWTGSPTASASGVVAYAESMSVALARGWDNYRNLTGIYHNTLTGRRADLRIGALYTLDNTGMVTLHEAETAVHVHLRHSASVGGTAGVFLWSGRIDTVEINGSDKGVYRMNVVYHANVWSAY